MNCNEVEKNCKSKVVKTNKQTNAYTHNKRSAKMHSSFY